MIRLGTIFAKNMKEFRRKCGFTQAQLAERVNVSAHHIGMLEQNRNFPTFDLIERIAKAFGIEMYELFVEAHSPRKELDELRQDIMGEIRQTIAEAVKESFEANYKDCVIIKK
jgi:transcriptional regulator with XRE-family HTH domain